MKRLCLAVIGLVALTGAAAAADLARPPPVPYYPKAAVFAPPYSWTGFYVGINGGGAFGSSSWDSTGSRNISGGLVGGTVGYNYQFGQVVAGVEGDIDWADINGSTNNACPAGCKTSDTWLVDRARPARLCRRPLHALRHRRRRVRRHPRLGPGLRVEFRHQCRLDCRRRPRSRTRRQLDGQGRISLCRSRQLQLRLGLQRGVSATDNVSFNTNLLRAGVNYKF